MSFLLKIKHGNHDDFTNDLLLNVSMDIFTDNTTANLLAQPLQLEE